MAIEGGQDPVPTIMRGLDSLTQSHMEDQAAQGGADSMQRRRGLNRRF